METWGRGTRQRPRGELPLVFISNEKIQIKRFKTTMIRAAITVITVM